MFPRKIACKVVYGAFYIFRKYSKFEPNIQTLPYTLYTHTHIYTSKFHKNYTVLQKETAKHIKSYALKKRDFHTAS